MGQIPLLLLRRIMEKTEGETGIEGSRTIWCLGRWWQMHHFGSRDREHFSRGGGAWEASGSSMSEGAVVAGILWCRGRQWSWEGAGD